MYKTPVAGCDGRGRDLARVPRCGSAGYNSPGGRPRDVGDGRRVSREGRGAGTLGRPGDRCRTVIRPREDGSRERGGGDQADASRDRAGRLGQGAGAEWKVDPAYLADLARGRRVPGPKILRALGLERVKTITYQPRKKPWHGRPAKELPPESDAPPPPRRGRPRGPVIRTAVGVLAAARLAMRLTLTEMAARCDLSAPYLSRLEAGHAGQPDRETSRRLAAGYGFSPARIRALTAGARRTLCGPPNGSAAARPGTANGPTRWNASPGNSRPSATRIQHDRRRPPARAATTGVPRAGARRAVPGAARRRAGVRRGTCLSV